MEEHDRIGEILQRLTRVETKLDNYNSLREKLETVCIKASVMEREIHGIKKGLWVVIAAVVANVFMFLTQVLMRVVL